MNVSSKHNSLQHFDYVMIIRCREKARENRHRDTSITAPVGRLKRAKSSPVLDRFDFLAKVWTLTKALTEKTEWKVATDAIQAVIRLRDRVTRNKNLEKVSEIETEIKGLIAKFEKLKPVYNASQTDLSTGGY